jgi:hypothetical protein
VGQNENACNKGALLYRWLAPFDTGVDNRNWARCRTADFRSCDGGFWKRRTFFSGRKWPIAAGSGIDKKWHFSGVPKPWVERLDLLEAVTAPIGL